MRPSRWLPGLATAMVLCAGCSGQAPESMGYGVAPPSPPARPVQAASPAAASFLAYEHQATITLDAAQLPQRLQQARQSCLQGEFGNCEVLQLSQSGGDQPSAQLVVRIVPDGVEPLIAAAAKGGRVGERNTYAEDLAQLVADNDQARDRLRREQARLEEFQQRRDLAVADMIALSRQLADVEAQLQARSQEAAQYQRRIQTQKVTLAFEVPGLQSGGGEIGQAMRDFVSILATGTAWTIRAVAFLIPVVLVLAVLLAVWRRLRRRRG
jgi:hypothetical protein